MGVLRAIKSIRSDLNRSAAILAAPCRLEAGATAESAIIYGALYSNSEIAEIHTGTDYFERNAERVRYPQFRRQHLFVGSATSSWNALKQETSTRQMQSAEQV